MPIAIALISLDVAVVAEAQSSSEVAAARGLFRQGLRSARSGEWDTACGHFERSYAIAPRPNTLLNLAGAQAQAGRLVAATESYRGFLSEAEGRAARFRPQAREALAELEPRLAHLVIRVEGLVAGDVVSLGERALPQAVLGVDLPVDPGESVVTVRRGEEEVARQAVRLAEGEARALTLEIAQPEVDLQISSPAAVDGREAPAAALAPDPATESDDTGLIVGVAVGVGVAIAIGVTVGAVLALDSGGPYQGTLGDGVIEFD